MTSLVEISTVTPVYRGEAHLPELVSALENLRSQWESSEAPLRLVEAIFVIDGAVDNSEKLLRQLAKEKNWVRLVTLSRNFGQHAATMAGISYSCGEWVVTLDEDMQHDPRHIEDLLRTAAKASSDIVYAKPAARVHQNFIRDAGSRFYKYLIVRLTNNPFVPLFNSYRLMRGSIARAAASVSSADTYFDVVMGWFTQRATSLKLDLKDRRFIESGHSGYNFWGLINHARRMIMTSETSALRIGALVGLLSILACFALLVIAVVEKYSNPDAIIQGWTSIFVLTSFVGGTTLFLLSIATEYLTAIRVHTQGKPTYFVVDRESDARIAAYFESKGASATS